jgi:DNA-binding NtrC family response regulator
LDSLSQKRVVVVDDDPNVRIAIKAVADRRGFAVALAANSSQFREIYQSFAPSTVFLDLNLPGGEDGVELLRFLAQQDCKAQIVLISGVGARVLSTVARLALVHGLDLVTTLKKPIVPADLEEAFVRAFGSHQLIKESDLRSALSQGELTLHYQPKINLATSSTRAIDTVEALIRWRHPKYGYIGPERPARSNGGMKRVWTWP